MRVYFDSSAWAKLYLREEGTDRMMEIASWADEMVVSILCLPEVLSAMNRRRREGTLSHDDYRRLKDTLYENLASVSVCNLMPEVLQRAVSVLEKCPLRALDALHIASAVECQADIFVSCDQRQLDAARENGLRTLSA
jgi:predicted nucleic acid-binding protein